MYLLIVVCFWLIGLGLCQKFILNCENFHEGLFMSPEISKFQYIFKEWLETCDIHAKYTFELGFILTLHFMYKIVMLCRSIRVIQFLVHMDVFYVVLLLI